MNESQSCKPMGIFIRGLVVIMWQSISAVPIPLTTPMACLKPKNQPFPLWHVGRFCWNDYIQLSLQIMGMQYIFKAVTDEGFNNLQCKLLCWLILRMICWLILRIIQHRSGYITIVFKLLTDINSYTKAFPTYIHTHILYFIEQFPTGLFNAHYTLKSYSSKVSTI